MRRLFIVVLEIFLALLLGLVINQLGLRSVAWIFGGMASGVLVFKSYRTFSLSSKMLKPNKIGRKIGQAFVGLDIGFSIADGNLAAASSKLPLFVLLTLFMLLCGSGIGYFYARISRTNLLNAMLATVPGGVAIMSSIAADYGRNVSLVALVQTLRITSVILIIPLVARASGANIANRPVFDFSNYLIDTNPAYLFLLFLTIILAGLGVSLARKLRLPAAPFFGTLIVGVFFNSLISFFPFLPSLDFVPPLSISLLGQILLGITIGESWSSRPNVRNQNITYALIPVAMTIASGFIAATLAMLVTSWDWLTCMLVTAPGGSTEMILVALSLDHNAEIVTVAHLVRLMALNLSLPLWLFLFRHWEKRSLFRAKT